MASLDNCEPHSSGLATLSNTLELFDTYKSSQDEEKDSDEESFHLPLLDCDDDMECNGKPLTGTDEPCENGETEDEILNKFESAGTPDIDSKIEDSILDDVDEFCPKESTDEISKNETVEETNKEPEEAEQALDSSTLETEKESALACDEIKASSDGEQIIAPSNNAEQVTISEKYKDTLSEIGETEAVAVTGATAALDNIEKEVARHEALDVCSKQEDALRTQGEQNMEVDESCKELTSLNEDTAKENQIDEMVVEGEQDNPVTAESSMQDTDMAVEQNENNSTDNTNFTAEKTNGFPETTGSCEAMDVGGQTEDKSEEYVAEEEVNKTQTEKKLSKDGDTVMEKASEEKNKDEHAEANSLVERENCENSNDSNKSQNLECDDLLDISIIRDADEDNASAIAENANDAHSSEKSDNEDQSEGSDKTENELDEGEMEQDENGLLTDKDDATDFDDSNADICDQDMQDNVTEENVTNDNTSDSDTRNSTKDCSTESNNNTSEVRVNDNEINKVNDSEKALTNDDSVKTNNVGINEKMAVDTQDSVKESGVKTSKRTLSADNTENTENRTKKIRIDSDEVVKSSNNVKTLITFEKYMQNKKLKNKLSRSDLEQFCLQKICEAIMHKTDVGELHQTIKKQEQIIDNLRKDLQQLTKQARDLDIVNKKLMNEMKVMNGKKPLVPLKITRSVGLQVKLNIGTETAVRRKQSVASPRTPNNTINNTINRSRNVTPTSNAVRQVAASPRKTPGPAPLLSQALQNRQVQAANAAKRTPIRSKPTETQKPGNPGVIDLTDEDDKASKNIVGTPVKILNKTIPMTQPKTVNLVPAKSVPNKTVNTTSKTVAVGQVKTATTLGTKVTTPTRTVAALPQGVRLTPTQVKNGSIAIPASVVTSSAGTTQLMYVVQPTSSLGQVVTTTSGGAQKAVLLNFQPSNGVLTSALNGSAVSVIPTKTTNTVQLKTVTAVRKHPAPLPTPPPIAINASLKPLLPKPHLSIRKTDTGIILQWRMPYNLDVYEGIASYQLFAYQETNAPPSTDMWRKVGDVKALALPMACTLTQFADKNKYYFAVRSVDVHKRIGAFSDPEEISL